MLFTMSMDVESPNIEDASTKDQVLPSAISIPSVFIARKSGETLLEVFSRNPVDNLSIRISEVSDHNSS